MNVASIPSFGSTLDTAAAYAAAGLSVVAIKPDGSKRPPFTWGEFEQRHATDKELRLWFGSGRNGIGVICGAISGGLEVIDFDSDLFEQWRLLVETEAPGLVERLPVVLTPGAGVHVFYRCTTIAGNQKLAVDAKRVVLIETRGEGGLVVAPGSPLTCHPAGKPYQLVRGDLRAIPEITPGEREVLLSVARSFNEYVASPLAVRAPAARPPGDGQRPGDAFNAKTTWADVLEPHGWRCVLERGQVGCWKRPGKDDVGWSATTNHAGSDLLYVFSSNAAPFEPERSYDRFAAYTILQHGGDFRAAAQALSEQGYGDRPLEVDLRKPTQKTSAAGKETPRLISAPDLQALQLKPPRYAVQGILPEGCSLLVGKAKMGKSWLALGLAVAVSSGMPALGEVEVAQGEVLYIAFEDGERRLQRRLNEILNDEPAPPPLTFATDWNTAEQGGLDDLERWITAHPDARLVIVDTLVRFRPPEKANAGVYGQDYRAVAPITDLAHRLSTTIMVVHHSNKRASGETDDPMDLISGSTGLSGAADGALIMRRQRGSQDALLAIYDRDTEDKELALRWNLATGGWVLLGDATDFKRSEQRNALLVALHDLGGASYRELATHLEKSPGSVRKLLWEMGQDGLVTNAGGRYVALAPRPHTEAPGGTSK